MITGASHIDIGDDNINVVFAKALKTFEKFQHVIKTGIDRPKK